MAHDHGVYDSDKHFVIDAVTRNINNQSEKVVLMQGDHNSERFTFELPKLVEDHDMSLCDVIEIHYINVSSNKAHSNSDIYIVDDVGVSSNDENMVCFTWLLSGVATKYAGSLNFRIRFACIDMDGNYTYKWHTGIFKGINISDGIDNSGTINEEYSDVLAAWNVEFQSLEERLETAIDSIITLQESYIGGIIE